MKNLEGRVGNRWECITYHLGTSQERNEIFELEDSNGNLDYKQILQYALAEEKAFHWPRRDAERYRRMAQEGKQLAEELAKQREARLPSQTTWELRYTL